MITVQPKVLTDIHKDVHLLLDYLELVNPISSYTIKYVFDYSVSAFSFNGITATGKVKVGKRVATIVVAAKNRSPRAVALTAAHEYMHCIQFIDRDLVVTPENHEELEKEAIKFAEDTLVTLWKEQKIFYPSS